MQVLTQGHRYTVPYFEHPEAEGQTIQFIEKTPSGDGSPTLITVNDGTTNEELIKVLIDRLQYLDGKFPCEENKQALLKLKEALMWLNKRTEDRKARQVEGKQLA